MRKSKRPEKFKSKFNEAINLKNSGVLEDALELFKELVQEYPNDFLGHVFVGLTYRDLKKLEEASLYLKKATILKPDSERASLCYFHALWEQNKTEEAVVELKRFLKKNDSKELSSLLRDIVNEE